MSKEITITAARLIRDVPAAEVRVDDALIAVSTLMTSVVVADPKPWRTQRGLSRQTRRGD